MVVSAVAALGDAVVGKGVATPGFQGACDCKGLGFFWATLNRVEKEHTGVV